MPGRDRPPVEASPLAVLVAAGALAAALGMLWVAVAVGAAAAGLPGPSNPVALPLELAYGRRGWPGTAATVVLAVEVAAVAAAGVLVWRWTGRWQRRPAVDRAARQMGRRRDLQRLGPTGARESAVRLLGAAPAGETGLGVLLGDTVVGGVPLYGSWEDTQAHVWGPRTGKTTSLVIPRVLDAPGPVLTTSNRRDVLDATRLPRSRVGRVWVFDPQAVANEEPAWWWNPLGGVATVTEAKRLAAHFAAASRPPDARRDAFFDPAGEDLLANLMLAAAVSGRDLLAVYRWLTDPVDREPERVLGAAGWDRPSLAVGGMISSPEKLRGSVYATAQQMASCLVEPAVTRWVTRPSRQLPGFDPVAFVAGTDTLYALSREGEGSAAPLVTALCAAVMEAGERLAARSPRGRLPVPMLAALDEVANVCRIRALPDLYSHYGGRGIVLIAVLQSWSQGEEVWGARGMAKLWSSANLRTYGGGVSESRFLEDLSRQVGEWDVATRSTSWSRGTRTVSRGTRRDRMLTVDQLAALPRGRVLLFASGMPATLIRPRPWYAGPHAAAVTASLARHDPGRAAAGGRLASPDSVVDPAAPGIGRRPR